jgi:hypothetical protein
MYRMVNTLTFPNIHADSPKMEPTNMKITLKEHQKALLYAIRERETNINVTINNGLTNMSSRFGYLCSKVGSGKSTTILAAISDKKQLKNDYKSHTHYTSNFIDITTVNKQHECLDIGSNIIVVPFNIFHQWSEFIIKHSNLKFLSITSSPTKIYDTLKSLYKFQCNTNKIVIPEDADYQYYITNIINLLHNYDVILIKSTSYTGFYNIINEYYFNSGKNIKFSRVIIDEVDTINIPNNHILCSYFTWFISASYEQVMYYKNTKNNGAIRNIMSQTFGHFSCIPKFDNNTNEIKKYTQRITINCCNDFIESSFVLPNINKYVINCYTPLYINTLQGFVDENVMSMLNSGNIGGAINKLGFTVVSEQDNLIDIVLKKFNIKIENLKKKHDYKKSLTYSNESDKIATLQKIESDILEIENKKTQLTDRIRTNMKSMCPICLADSPNDPVILSCECKSVYCMKCLCMSIQTTPKCPMCRENINMKAVVAINKNIDSTKLDKNSIEFPSKNEALKKIFKSNPNGKYIIFTHSPETLNSLSNDDDGSSVHSQYDTEFWGDIKCSILKGSSATIQKRINEFKNGAINVLLMNSYSYCAGMNLQCTTDVIIYHKLVSDIEKQAIGRAQRIGRTSPLNVHYLKHNNE